MSKAIEARDIQKVFPGHRKGDPDHQVLKGLTLAVDEGEFVCVLGPSGCGKSTLLNLLSGLDRDYKGSISFGGQAADKRGRPPVRLGYLFQDPRLLPWLTAEQNVDFVLSTCRVPAERWDPIKDHYFSLTKLNDFRSHYPHEMSGGMCQRLSLVRSLSVEPDLLLMDEPFSGLDELTARRMRVDLMEIAKKTGKTIIFITHNSYEATFLADRVVVMAQGEINKEIKVGMERPRDYDDPDIFNISKEVSSTFIRVAESNAPAA